MAEVDVAAMWDFNQPAVSEARFRAAMAGASADDQAILLTQVARSHGLRRDFATARTLLAPLAAGLGTLSPEAQTRWHLEMGRSFASATHKPEEQDTAQAREHFLRAAELARAARLDALQIDALHMLPFVEAEPQAALAWEQQALAVLLASEQPAAPRWELSLRNNIGLSLHRLGRLEDALAEFERALAVSERDHAAPRQRVARWMVGWTLRGLDRLDEALALQQRLEAEHRAAGSSDEYVFDELALLHEAKGNTAQAAHYRTLRSRARQP